MTDHSSHVHRSHYQRRDHEVVDYEEYTLRDTGLVFRGPDPRTPPLGEQLAFLGAAQTLGCFTAEPFPTSVGVGAGRPVRNLGYGGAGPRFFVEHPELVAEVNRSALAVVQVMSARSEDNRLFRSAGLEFLERRADGARIGAGDAYRGLLRGFDPITGRPRSKLWRALNARRNRPLLRDLVVETRANWVDSYRQLFGTIEIPTILLWFSTREPQYEESYRSLDGLFGQFPQLVNQQMVDAVGQLADRTVTVVSDEGLPQPLFSRFDGRPCTVDPGEDRADLGGSSWTHNAYYPSPEMHATAARALGPVVRQLLRTREA